MVEGHLITEDTTIKQNLVREIYQKANVSYKQFITVKTYQTSPKVSADHMFVLNKSTFFGGPNGITALHYYGAWKWLLGAAWDLDDNKQLDNPYLYGDSSTSSGLQGFEHERDVTIINTSLPGVESGSQAPL